MSYNIFGGKRQKDYLLFHTCLPVACLISATHIDFTTRKAGDVD